MDRIEIEEDGTTGDNLQASRVHSGHVVMTIENPWSGDTETGFGRSGSITLTPEQVARLVAFLGH